MPRCWLIARISEAPRTIRLAMWRREFRLFERRDETLTA